MNEGQAIERCLRHRDPDGFNWLVRAHQREAYLHALALLGNAEDAADACQDAFRKAFLAMPRLAALDRFYPWFYRILRNHCLNLLERRRTAIRSRDLVATQHEMDASGGGDLANALEREEEADRVRSALAALPVQHREILSLKYFHEMTYEALAELLDVPKGTVMSRLYHARRAFREVFETREARR